MTQYIIRINCHYADDAHAEAAIEHAIEQAVEAIGTSAESPKHSIHAVALREDSSGTLELANYTLEPWNNEA